MEEIKDTMTIRRKNTANSLEMIKKSLQQISSIHLEKDTVLQKVKENEKKINELSAEVSVLKEEYKIEKQSLESKVHESEDYKQQLKILKEDKEQIDVSVNELETKHKGLKKTKPSLKDQKLIELGKRKHELYKEFTNVRWDYSAPDNVVEGYITNKKDYLQKISYKGNIDYKTLKEFLWRDIKKSTFPTKSSGIEEIKENQPINK